MNNRHCMFDNHQFKSYLLTKWQTCILFKQSLFPLSLFDPQLPVTCISIWIHIAFFHIASHSIASKCFVEGSSTATGFHTHQPILRASMSKDCSPSIFFDWMGRTVIDKAQKGLVSLVLQIIHRLKARWRQQQNSSLPKDFSSRIILVINKYTQRKHIPEAASLNLGHDILTQVDHVSKRPKEKLLVKRERLLVSVFWRAKE